MTTIANGLAHKTREDVEHTFSKSHEVKEWQLQLLPFMKKFISVMAAAFFLFSIYYMRGVSKFIENDGDDRKPAEPQQLVHDTLGKVFLLEKEIMDRRYHHRGALLMARVGTTQLTFMTGMVMAFMGTMLILGKMSESVSQITSKWHVGISSASPGIILSFFGTVLIVTSLMNNLRTNFKDTPVYFSMYQNAPESPGPNPPAPKQPEDIATDFTGN